MAQKQREKEILKGSGQATDLTSEEDQRGEDGDDLGRLGQRFMKGLLPTPDVIVEAERENDVLLRERKKGGALEARTSQETGLGGGVRHPMPGGSDVDWGRGRDR